MRLFLLILVLLLTVGAAAYFTRPSESHFERFAEGPRERSFETPAGRVTLETDPLPLEDYDYHNRYLWATVEQAGRTVYIGAFGAWFEWTPPEVDLPDLPEELEVAG